MLNKTLNSKKVAIDRQDSFLDDPIAMQTAWFPKEKGNGSNFQMHKLVKVDSMTMEFRTTLGVLIFQTLFILVFIGMLIGAGYGYSLSNFSFADHSYEVLEIIALLGGFLGIVVAVTSWCSLFFHAIKPIVFDKAKGFFWKGWRKPDLVVNGNEVNDFVALNKIKALQLISKECTSDDDKSYVSYELNLVLRDRSRINVIDHGDQKKIREDANTLSFFLKKPVWDAS